jgi:hypothetical protein
MKIVIADTRFAPRDAVYSDPRRFGAVDLTLADGLLLVSGLRRLCRLFVIASAAPGCSN